MITQLSFDEFQEVLITMRYIDIDIDQSLEIKRDPDIDGMIHLNLRRDHPLFNIILIRTFANRLWRLDVKIKLEALAENFYEIVTDKL